MTSITNQSCELLYVIVTGDFEADLLANGVPAQTETLPEQPTGGRVLVWAQSNMSRKLIDREILGYKTVLSKYYRLMASE